MKKIILVALTIFLCGIKSYAENDIAVVDLTKIVNESSQVKTLKQEHTKKTAELDKIIANARGEIANEKNPEKILLLEDKYMKEFNTKKEALEKNYNSKLTEIEKNIKSEISQIAKNKGYKYVFAKSVVLFGGEDITENIIRNIK
ncbi:MAG: OmpH family outer membrane protein [bacterium]|nr:OmpH family outer membrane protein [bacterium]